MFTIVSVVYSTIRTASASSDLLVCYVRVFVCPVAEEPICCVAEEEEQGRKPIIQVLCVLPFYS